jgi:uncharacterized protein YjbJ (UPF0337 family)
MDQVKGKLKEEAGKATGDRSTEAEGHGDQFKGKAKEALGDAKDALDKGKEAITKS